MKTKLIIIGLCIILAVLLSGCACREYEKFDKCVEWEEIEVPAVDKIFVRFPYNQTSISFSDMEGIFSNQNIKIITVRDSPENPTVTKVEIEKEWNGTGTISNCTKKEKRMVCVR